MICSCKTYCYPGRELVVLDKLVQLSRAETWQDTPL